MLRTPERSDPSLSNISGRSVCEAPFAHHFTLLGEHFGEHDLVYLLRRNGTVIPVLLAVDGDDGI